MRRQLTLCLSVIATFYSLMAQHTQLTLDDVVRGGANYSAINAPQLKHLQWKDKDHYSYTKNDSTLAIANLKGKVVQQISCSDLEQLFPNQSFHRLPSIHWVNGETLSFYKNHSSFFYNNTTQQTRIISYPENAQNIDIAYPYQHAAYTLDNNLYIATEDSTSIAVSTYHSPNIVCGQTVHRNEFGISKGTFWSPNGQQLAYYIKDESAIHNYPLVDITARAAEVKFIKYPMAGMASEVVKVGIYNRETQERIQLKTKGAEDHYLTNISWSPDNKYLYLAEINRGQDTMQLNCYDSQTGDLIRTLFSETHSAYVEPQNPLLFLPNNNERFLWQSRRDGYNHLYLYNSNGELIQQISQGPWEVTAVLGFDAQNQHIIVTTTEPSPLERHIYALGLNDNSKTQHTSTAGYHRALLSPDGNSILDRWSSTEQAETIDLIQLNKKHQKSLAQSQDPYKDFEMGHTQIITIKAADDSTELYGRLILPPHFDATKKHPTIIYVYGGPHSQLINNSWYANVQMWQHYMAQKGYVMFTLDNRGTSYRGAAFEQIIHRQLGKHEMADQMKGYDYLCQQSYVDTARIGVFGWSYGGFMSTSLMTHYPNAFKVGVAGGPVIDWRNYEVMYGERYMDRPQENPEGYEATNLCHHAHRLKGRLLMIHGAQDPVVVWQHSQKFVRQCIKEGVQLDYFVYPTHEHNVRGQDRVHLMDKISQHFDDHL